MNKSFLLVAFTALLASSQAAAQSSDLRFEVAAMPEFQKYTALFVKPGYAAVVLETSGLSPSAK